MLKPTKMANDVMFSIAMYFAAALKRRLLRDTESVWPLLLILSMVAVWLRFEHMCAAHKKELGDKELTVGLKTLFEIVYLFSQTMLFLLVQVVVHVIDQSVSEQSLWLESVLLPCFMILMCVLVVTFAKQRAHGD